jgi:hypothetical protein
MAIHLDHHSTQSKPILLTTLTTLTALTTLTKLNAEKKAKEDAANAEKRAAEEAAAKKKADEEAAAKKKADDERKVCIFFTHHHSHFLSPFRRTERSLILISYYCGVAQAANHRPPTTDR